jgi:hypothetical protein
MKFLFLLAFTLLLVGCNRDHGNKADAAPAAEYTPRMPDFQTIRKFEPGMTDFCIERFLAGDRSPIPDEKCFKFGAPERMSGTWAAMFEGSQFCPDSWKECAQTDRAPRAAIWLEFAQPLKFDVKSYIGGLYAIDFVGRRTIYSGHYGHMGVFSHEVIVDRIISMRQLKAPPKS